MTPSEQYDNDLEFAYADHQENTTAFSIIDYTRFSVVLQSSV